MIFLKEITDYFLQPLKDNMRMFYIILNCLVLLLCGCKEEVLENYSVVNSNEDILPVPIVWQIPLDEDTSIKYSIAPKFYNGGVLFSSIDLELIDPMLIKFAGSEFGNILWQTDAAFEVNCSSPTTGSGNGSYIYDHYYVTLCNSDPRVVDLNDGSVFWHYECPGERMPKITHFNNILFHVHLTGFNPFSSASIVFTDIYTGIWDTIFTLDMVDDYSVGLYPPTALIDVNNDTILYFQNRQYKTLPYDGKVDLYAYNMSADTIVWMVNDIDPHGNSSIYPPLYFEGKIYFKGTYTLFCLDAQTGEIVWQKLFTGPGEDLLMGNLMEVENKIIVKTSYESIYALDPVTGSVIWENQDAGATPTDMVYYNGVLYYGSSGDANLHAINTTTGVQLWEMESPNNKFAISEYAAFIFQVAIDPILNRLYTSDGYYLMCFQLEN